MHHSNACKPLVTCDSQISICSMDVAPLKHPCSCAMSRIECIAVSPIRKAQRLKSNSNSGEAMCLWTPPARSNRGTPSPFCSDMAGSVATTVIAGMFGDTDNDRNESPLQLSDDDDAGVASTPGGVTVCRAIAPLCEHVVRFTNIIPFLHKCEASALRAATQPINEDMFNEYCA